MKENETFHIANQEQVIARVEKLGKRSDDIRSRLALILKKLWITERKLLVVQNLEVFSELKLKFPNFIEAIALYEANAIGLSNLGLPFEAPPVLLSGDPGLGKTYFASELAKALTLPFYEISMATMTASFALSGGNLQWSEGDTGFIANSLADSPFGNPFVLIDELDKSGLEQRYSPMQPFYSLLEPHSARRFRDEALEINLDASRVIWQATANNLNEVPQPILSRMKIIDIKRPDINQMIQVVKNIYTNYITQKPCGQLLDPDISESVMELLCQRSPREAKLAIDEASLKTICANRTSLIPSDLPVARKEHYRVGFIK